LTKLGCRFLYGASARRNSSTLRKVATKFANTAKSCSNRQRFKYPRSWRIKPRRTLRLDRVYTLLHKLIVNFAVALSDTCTSACSQSGSCTNWPTQDAADNSGSRYCTNVH
jgi:hypothetical protein